MKTYKRISLLLALALLISLFTFTAYAQPTEGSDEEGEGGEEGSGIVVNMDPMKGFDLDTGFGVLEGFTTEAKAALLYDLNSDSYLYSLEIDKKIFPASLTKLITCLVAVEYLNFDDPITVPSAAVDAIVEWLRTKDIMAGETMTVYDLLHYVLLDSSNEGANTIALEVAGSLDAFVELMNAKAKELGCTGTNFANPHGLHNENHYTTVRDLLLISKAFLANEDLRDICYKTRYSMPDTNLQKAKTILTTNMLTSTDQALRYYYEPARGVKTGNTDEAGRCLISTAELNGMNVLVIVTGCPTRKDAMDEWILYNFTEAKLLLQYSYRNFMYVTALTPDSPVAEVPVSGGMQESVFVAPVTTDAIALPKDYDTKQITTEVTLKSGTALQAPVYKGDVVGTASVYYQGELMATVDVTPISNILSRESEAPLTADTPGENNGFKLSFGMILLIICGVLLLYYVYRYVYINVNRRKRRQQKAAAQNTAASRNQDSTLVTILKNLQRRRRRRRR